MAEDYIIDYRKPKKYMGKEWIALKNRQEQLKGKIKKFASSSSTDFTEVRRGRLFMGGTPVKKISMGGSMHEHKWIEYRYGKYGQHQINKSYIEYLKKYMKKFKLMEVRK